MSRDIFYYTYLTYAGPVTLFPEGTGYMVIINREKLGTYPNLEEAFTAAVTGETSTAWSEGTLAELDLPGNIDGWQKKLFATISRLRAAP